MFVSSWCLDDANTFARRQLFQDAMQPFYSGRSKPRHKLGSLIQREVLPSEKMSNQAFCLLMLVVGSQYEMRLERWDQL